MTINVIYDNRSFDKKELLLKEFSNQGINDYKFWDCVVITNDVVSSINASHKNIVRYAKENGLKEVCIAEDDLMFPCVGAWDYFLNNKPDNFDLYLSATYVVSHPLKHICGFHLYVVNESFYDKFLSASDSEHIDTVMDSIKGNFVFCYPFAALQRPGFSANNKSVVNYNSVLEPKHIFNGNTHNI